ncbi:MAG TPA: NAD-dependent epimerase/dehydratase family protein [Lacipirellulaceae bacterium]|nr:NAD-dependent epimerase/dehydratase family protein [Lacipirellulaceae bacterium]
MARRAFVTGSTGFIGAKLIADLVAHGYEVRALVRSMERARGLPAGVQPVLGDVTERESMRDGIAGADVVFHVAALYTVGVAPNERERIWRVNVDGTRNTLELATELGAEKIVYTSTVGVFGNTKGQLVDESYRAPGSSFESEYERTKYIAHYEVAVPLQQRGAPVVIVCPGLVYGPGDTSQMGDVIRMYARGRLPLMIGPENAITWAHVDDIVAGHRLAAEKGRPGETYILAGPAHTYREFFEIAGRATGQRGPQLWLPSGVAGRLARLFARVRPGTAELLQQLAGISYLARADKARAELGWTPRPVEIGIQQTVGALRDAGGA